MLNKNNNYQYIIDYLQLYVDIINDNKYKKDNCFILIEQIISKFKNLILIDKNEDVIYNYHIDKLKNNFYNICNSDKIMEYYYINYYYFLMILILLQLN